jgi:putative glycosyltransferase (TIGR04372 family)
VVEWWTSAIHEFYRARVLFKAIGCLLRDMRQISSTSILSTRRAVGPRNAWTRLRARYLELWGNQLAGEGALSKAVLYWVMANKCRQSFGIRSFGMSNQCRLFANNYNQSIGHIGLIACHVKMRMLGWIGVDTKFFLLAPPGRTANQPLVRYFAKYVSVIDDPFLCNIIEPVREFAEEPVSVLNVKDGECAFLYKVFSEVETKWGESDRPPLFQLSDEHRSEGRKVLAKMCGGGAADKFVAVHVRTSGFSSHGGTVHESESVRSSDIGTYTDAFKAIIARRYLPIRVGDSTTPRVREGLGVFDYAHSSCRSDWMDIFLFAEAAFMIGTQSGPQIVSSLFGTQNVDVNWAPPAVRPFNRNCVFIPKLLRDRRTGRLLSLREQISEPLGFIEETEQLKNLGLEAVDNSPDEIVEVVEEMMDRVEGRWRSCEQDNRLQARYDDVCLSAGGYLGAPVGRQFLRKYAPVLLGEQI